MGNICCDSQYMHKELIKELYLEYNVALVKRRKINKSTDAFHLYTKIIKEKEEKLVNNLHCYCKNYPDEKINTCNECIFEYKEYPYRLIQNLDKIIELL